MSDWVPTRSNSFDVKAEWAAEQVRVHGGIRAAQRATGVSFGTLKNWYDKAIEYGFAEPLEQRPKTREEMKETEAPVVKGRIKAMETPDVGVPKRGVRRFVLTCAQNNTRVHGPFWTNLLAYADKIGARVLVSRFTYSKRQFGGAAAKPGTGGGSDYDDLWYDPAVVPYIHDERLQIAPGLVWCGEMNILPTAVRPLNDLDSYTGRASAVFPHVKIAMRSVPSMRDEATKFTWTTGTVTQRNYIARKAGLKAEFHHCYGALLVEVDSDGDWFCRQLNADSEGTFHDLAARVSGGKVSEQPVEAVTWGDVHVEMLDETVRELAWGRGGMLDTLRPKYQFMHDVLDFRGRSHHERRDPHKLYKRWLDGSEDVESEVWRTLAFIASAGRPWCETVVVDSNHHQHLGRWLREDDGRWDPVNAEFWLRMNLRAYRDTAMRKTFNPLRAANEELGFVAAVEDARFLDEDESFVICPDANGGIECGMHGDLGPDGARGSAIAFTRMGRKANIGHTHKAGIEDGVYVAGTSSILTPDYVRGPGSWSHSHVVTYANGKRAVVTMWNGKWRAGG